ncbi:hypothetical protein [Bacillus subtilis]|uniref:hypothetical protein n=1 Tax=Bacillus subtilis TaxID=1423 RepID=UPI003F850661
MKIKKWGLIAATVIILLPMFGNLANAAEPLDKGKNDWKFSTYERSTKPEKLYIKINRVQRIRYGVTQGEKRIRVKINLDIYRVSMQHLFIMGRYGN